MSPGVPASVGVAIPTVYLRETVASPCMNKEFASKPLDDVDVTLLENMTGPVNSDIALPSSPPSTLIDCVNVPSVALTRLISVRFDISSPVTVLIGVSNTSSLPVTVLTFLLPANQIPLSFIPVK